MIRRHRYAPWLKAAAVALGMLFLAAVVGVGWAFQTGRAAMAVRTQLVRELRERCDVAAEFEALEVAPLGRELRLRALRLTDLNGRPLLRVEEALVSLQLIPLFYGRFQLERVALLAPEATLRLRDGRLVNLPRCLQPREAPRPTRSPVPIALGISELTIERGAVELDLPGDVGVFLRDVGIGIEREEAGGTSVALGVDDVALRWPGHDLVVQRFRLLGRLEGLLTQPRALVVDVLEVVAAESLKLHGSGSIDLVGPVFDIRLDVAGPASLVPRYVDGAPPASGAVRLAAHVTGTPISPRAQGELRLSDLAVARYGPFDRAELTFVADRRGVRVEPLEITQGTGRVTGEVELDFERGFPFRAEVAASDLSLGRVLDALDVRGPWVDLRASGPAELRGTLAPLELTGPFDFAVRDLVVFNRGFDAPEVEGPLDDVPAEFVILRTAPCRARGTWTFEPENLHFSEGRVLADGSSGDVWARVGLQPRLGHDVGVDFSTLDFRDLGPIAGVELQGDGALRGVLRVPYQAKPRADADVDLAGFTIEDIPFGYVASPLRWRDGTELRFPAVKGQLGSTRYEGSAVVRIEPGVPSDLEVRFRDGQLEDLLIPFGVVADDWGASGRVDAEARLAGPILELAGPIELRGRELSLYGQSVDALEAGVEMVRGAVRLDRFSARKGDATVTGLGRFDPVRRRIAAHAWTRGLTLSHLDAVSERFPRLTGEVDIDARLEGPLDAAKGRYSVDLRDVSAGQVPLGEGSVQGPIDGRRIGVSARAFAGRLALDADLAAAPQVPYEAHVELTELPLISAVSELLEGELRGALTLSGDLRGRLGDLDATAGELQLSLLHFEGFGLVLDAPRPLKITVDRGVASTERFDLVGPGARIVADGRVSRWQADLGLSGRLELSLLETYVPQIERGSGDLRFDADVSGRWADVEVVGTASLRQGFARWSWIEEPITELDADLRFSQRRIILESARGRWASGRIEADGRTGVGGPGLRNLDVSIRLDRPAPTFLLPAADVTGRLVGELRLSGTSERLRLAGAVRASGPRIEPQVDLRTLVDYSAPPATYDPRAELIEMDVRVDMNDSVRVEGDAVDFEMDGAVRITGTNQRPGLLGDASVRTGGRVTFLGRTYTFRAGSVEFRDRLSFAPQYDLTLAAEACSARIRVNVVGTLETFESVYSSTPEMDPRDVVSCLLRGIRIRELDDERAIGAFAGNTLLKLSGVDQEVKKVVPVDQIDVTSEFSNQAREYQPYVLLAKELNFMSASARLEYQSSLLQSTDQRAAIRLRLTPRLNLTFGWASSLDVPLGDWGLDLEHRWEW